VRVWEVQIKLQADWLGSTQGSTYRTPQKKVTRWGQRPRVSPRIALRYRLFKVESGINGVLPTSWVPSIYSVSRLSRLRFALGGLLPFAFDSP
jgi:hypothetical protein